MKTSDEVLGTNKGVSMLEENALPVDKPTLNGVSVTGMEIVAVIETPKGSRNKYEVDPRTGLIWLDRLLFTATQYPADYGYVPGTLTGEGDPLDVLVLDDEPTFPGCHIRARPVGMVQTIDEKGRDIKILSVPATAPR